MASQKLMTWHLTQTRLWLGAFLRTGRGGRTKLPLCGSGTPFNIKVHRSSRQQFVSHPLQLLLSSHKCEKWVLLRDLQLRVSPPQPPPRHITKLPPGLRTPGDWSGKKWQYCDKFFSWKSSATVSHPGHSVQCGLRTCRSQGVVVIIVVGGFPGNWIKLKERPRTAAAATRGASFDLMLSMAVFVMIVWWLVRKGSDFQIIKQIIDVALFLARLARPQGRRGLVWSWRVNRARLVVCVFFRMRFSSDSIFEFLWSDEIRWNWMILLGWDFGSVQAVESVVGHDYELCFV